MPSDLRSILTLEVPIIVLLGERQMPLSAVVALVPGSIIELPKGSDEELTLLANNKPVGTGVAVKVGENFGIRIAYIGDIQERILAMGATSGTQQAVDPAEALAEQLLAGQ